MSDAKFTVAVLDNQFVDVPYVADVESEVLKGVAQVVCLGARTSSNIPEKMEDVDAVLAWHHITDIDRKVLERMKKTQVIVRIGMGYDNIDTNAAADLGIKVCNVPDYGIEEVADSTICFILNLMRKTYQLANGTKAGRWNTSEAYGATRLNGRTLGLVGIGRIGTAVALRAKAFGLNVIFYDPYAEHGRVKSLGLASQVETLDQLLESSDIISLHCPLIFNEVNNKHLINKENILRAKKGAIIINTARGPIIEEEALVSALSSGHLSGAALDVFEKEPYVDGPLLKMENVIVTPHSAFYSDQGMLEMRTKAALEAKRVLTGEEPRYWVNKEQFKKK